MVFFLDGLVPWFRKTDVIPETAGGEAEAVKAYDAYVKSAVVPFVASCDALMNNDIGKLITQAWEGVRDIVVLATRAKAPDAAETELANALAPFLTKTQNAVKAIREVRMADRKFDYHHKAIIEMLGCLSWILQKPPRAPLPAAFVKESLGSAEFWSNRIRKEYKGKDDVQIAFCDGIKAVVLELSEYIASYHKTGLAFNPRGTSIAEAAIRLSDAPATDAAIDIYKSPKGAKRHPTLGIGALAGGNIAGVMSELSKRQTADGSSAATGLKRVRFRNCVLNLSTKILVLSRLTLCWSLVLIIVYRFSAFCLLEPRSRKISKPGGKNTKKMLHRRHQREVSQRRRHWVLKQLPKRKRS
jgi:hypothetical protein